MDTLQLTFFNDQLSLFSRRHVAFLQQMKTIEVLAHAQKIKNNADRGSGLNNGVLYSFTVCIVEARYQQHSGNRALCFPT